MGAVPLNFNFQIFNKELTLINIMTFSNSVKSVSYISWCLILAGNILNFFSVNFWVSVVSFFILTGGFFLGLGALVLSFNILFTEKRSADLIVIFIINLMCFFVLTFQFFLSLPHPT